MKIFLLNTWVEKWTIVMSAPSKERREAWDKFAAAALAGVTSNPESGCNSPADLAHWAARCATALLIERDKQFSQPQLPLKFP